MRIKLSNLSCTQSYLTCLPMRGGGSSGLLPHWTAAPASEGSSIRNGPEDSRLIPAPCAHVSGTHMGICPSWTFLIHTNLLFQVILPLCPPTSMASESHCSTRCPALWYHQEFKSGQIRCAWSSISLWVSICISWSSGHQLVDYEVRKVGDGCPGVLTRLSTFLFIYWPFYETPIEVFYLFFYWVDSFLFASVLILWVCIYFFLDTIS